MDFEKFCTTNCMTEEETKAFNDWLKDRKDNLEPRSINNWLYLFNVFFDN